MQQLIFSLVGSIFNKSQGFSRGFPIEVRPAALFVPVASDGAEPHDVKSCLGSALILAVLDSLRLMHLIMF